MSPTLIAIQVWQLGVRLVRWLESIEIWMTIIIIITSNTGIDLLRIGKVNLVMK